MSGTTHASAAIAAAGRLAAGLSAAAAGASAAVSRHASRHDRGAAPGDRDAGASPARAGIVVRDVAKVYPGRHGDVLALASTDVTVAPGQFVAIVGRSGCGKSTLLRLMAGLNAPSQGCVTVGGEVLRGRPPTFARFVFQDFSESLFQWQTVARNVAFGLRHRLRHSGLTPADADHYLSQVGLASVANRYPHELSGGMQQRLAIARALASAPRFLFMDEPFSAIDALSRARLQDLTLQLWHELSLTVVMVTHDIDEAVYLANRVLVLAPDGAGIAHDLEIDLPWPRTQLGTKESAAFLDYRRSLTKWVVETE
ncbi:ABC transporter ATP-binding protein [Chitinasiproducens palmae]|uniref:NitT/TauT family transport system ATP-binding protein n=1 Tax=Chitinasiproducens palmae TaxID=1770053 RepID=A0A1H2PPY5_9BURK|nr:ABC transporter ATP-binding protein [Chitinasiproducens palmae]SDV48866.1 NitT/TauT family transport system ATP-binding protein [Chitinasiproducens palmae]